MSKFCRVISEQPLNPESEFQLDFGQLDALADWLINETNYMCEDLQRKGGFMQEQHKKIVYNEQNIKEMNDKLRALHDGMTQLELEIQENGLNMLQMERSVDVLERLQFCDMCPTSSWRNPQATVLHTLENTDRNMMCLTTLMEDFSENFNPEIQLQMNPYQIIGDILDCHNQTLAGIETKIAELSDETVAIDEVFSSLLSIEKYCSKYFFWLSSLNRVSLQRSCANVYQILAELQNSLAQSYKAEVLLYDRANKRSMR